MILQVVVGSFIADAKRPKQKPSLTPTPPPPPSNMLNFGPSAAAAVNSPTSEGPSSDSDEENSRSPPHHHHGSLPYNSGGQPMQPMPMYANMGWPNSTAKMLP